MPVKYIKEVLDQKVENFDKAKLEYTRATVEYKKRRFLISQRTCSVTPEWEYEIEVFCKWFWDNDSFFLQKPKETTYISWNTIKTIDEALDLVKDFINNELQ